MKNFFDCKEEKITEKVFSQSLFISVFSILLCLVALCSMTYAWFTEGVSNSSNTLISGSFEIKELTVVKIDDGATLMADGEDSISVTNQNGVYSCTLPENGTYLVKLSCGDSTSKGRCIIMINDTEKSTVPIIGNKTANPDNYTIYDPFTFKITTSKETVVEFRSVWGVAATPEIEYNMVCSADDWKISSESSTAEPEP